MKENKVVGAEIDLLNHMSSLSGSAAPSLHESNILLYLVGVWHNQAKVRLEEANLAP